MAKGVGRLSNTGPVVGSTAYAEGVLVGREINFAMPAISFQTVDMRAMGTYTMPIPMLEAMEATITKIGVDMGLINIVRTGNINLELRWAQEALYEDGSKAVEGCKAFIRGKSGGLASITIEPGATIEQDVTIQVDRFQLFVAGKEVCLADRFARKLVINGNDAYSEIERYL